VQLAASVLVYKSFVVVFLATSVEAVLTTEFFLSVASAGKESYTFGLSISFLKQVLGEGTFLAFWCPSFSL